MTSENLLTVRELRELSGRYLAACEDYDQGVERFVHLPEYHPAEDRLHDELSVVITELFDVADEIGWQGRDPVQDADAFRARRRRRSS